MYMIPMNHRCAIHINVEWSFQVYVPFIKILIYPCSEKCFSNNFHNVLVFLIKLSCHDPYQE